MDCVACAHFVGNLCFFHPIRHHLCRLSFASGTYYAYRYISTWCSRCLRIDLVFFTSLGIDFVSICSSFGFRMLLPFLLFTYLFLLFVCFPLLLFSIYSTSSWSKVSPLSVVRFTPSACNKCHGKNSFVREVCSRLWLLYVLGIFVCFCLLRYAFYFCTQISSIHFLMFIVGIVWDRLDRNIYSTFASLLTF